MAHPIPRRASARQAGGRTGQLGWWGTGGGVVVVVLRASVFQMVVVLRPALDMGVFLHAVTCVKSSYLIFSYVT